MPWEHYDSNNASIELLNGKSVEFDSAKNNPTGVSFVRVRDPQGNEIGYWVSDEWKEAPEEVMGAILGALCDD